MDDAIHIGVTGFPRLALRMARAAARMAYGDRRELPPPRLESIAKPRFGRNQPFTLDVAFANVVGGLRAGGEPVGFAIVDGAGVDQGVVHKTTLHGNVARLHLALASPVGMYVTYGHGTMPICNITDGRDEGLLVFSPVPLATSKPAALFPFIRKWNVTGVIPHPAPLAEIDMPDPAAHGAQEREYVTEFTDEHLAWQSHPEGHCYFSTKIKLPETMKLEFLMGYDGPIRFWLDGKPFYQDLKGINPIIIDEKHRAATLAAGIHEMRVAMDINRGQAWGFCVRMRRMDVTRAQIASGNYTKAEYLV
jgi:sialate O-acetylesterase